MSLAGDEASRRARYVDLTLGAWRPREVALQLAASLDLTLPPAANSSTAAGLAAAYAEGAGDPLIMTAYQDAAAIAPRLPGGSIVAVLAPRWNLPFRLENEWFLFFLRRHGLSITLLGDDVPTSVSKSLFERRKHVAAPEAVIRPDAASDEQRRMLRFFPGLLPVAIADRLQIGATRTGLVPYGPHHLLVPVTWRDRDPRASPRDLDALGEVEGLDHGLLALAQSFCTNYFADPAALAALADRALAGGSTEIARELAERARAVARQPEEAAIAELRRQQVRLAERRFAEMVAAPEPSRHASGGVKEELRRLRAVAAVMAGDLGLAERDVAVLEGRLKERAPLYPEDLHFLNTVADVRLAKGDAGGAFRLAEAIDAALRGEAVPDPRLVFENALTLARIHRLRGGRADQRAALDRAFAATDGRRTLAEVIEMNALRAAAAEDPQSPEARLAWLRASLAWLVIEPTEGLARRAMLAVLGAEAPRAQLDLDVSDALATALAGAWPSLMEKGEGNPAFRAAGGSLRPARLFAAPGVGVLWTDAAEAARVSSRPRLTLTGLAAAALRELGPGLAGADGGTVLVDTNLGRDIPATRADALSVALRHGATGFTFGDEALALDEAHRTALVAALRVTVSPVVARIADEGPLLVVTFHRPLSERTLSRTESTAVSAVRDAPSLRLSAIASLLRLPLGETEALLRGLEAAQVVRLDVAEM